MRLVPGRPPHPGVDPHDRPPVRSGGYHILVVEDDQAFADTVVRLLTHETGTAGSVTLAHSMAEVEALDRTGSPVDVILLELGLDDSDGAESIERAAAAWPQTPIIVLSGSTDEKLARSVVRLGAHEFIPKLGLDARDLARSIHLTVDRHAEELRRRLAMERFSAALDHDLRTPLVTVEYITAAMTELLDRPDPDTSALGERLARIVDQIHDADLIVRELLDEVRAQSVGPRRETIAPALIPQR